MTEVVGSAAIELRLDRSRLNRDLRDLETLQLKPIALGVKFDLPQLQRQLQGVALAPIAIGLSADISGLAKQLQAFSGNVTVKATLDTSDIDRQLKAFGSDRTLKLTAQVDDSQLTALNRHLDLKAKHFAQVNDAWRRSPLTPRVDLSQLNGLDGRLRSLQKRYDIDVNLRVDAGQLRSAIGTLEVPVILRYANAQPLGALTQKVDIDTKGIEDSLGNSVERAFKRVKGGGLLGGIGSLITAPLRLAGGGISNILSGLAFGATQQVSLNLGKGLSTALEGALSKSVGSSALLGEKVGGAIGSAVVQQFEAQTQNLAQVLDKQIEKVKDKKLRADLREQFDSVVALPGQVKQAVTGTIGQDNITREKLFQRGQQRQSQQEKTPVVREEAVAEFRDALTTSKSVEVRATKSKATLEQQISIRQQEVAEVGQRYEQLAEAIQQAELGGAQTEDIAPLASQLNATAQGLQELSQSLATLVQARDIAANAVQEAKQARVAARQQLDQVSPPEQPKAYTELAQSVLGESFDEAKLPKLVVDEARLKGRGAGSAYVPAENAIITTNKIYEAIQQQALTQQQADVLGEEIAHAEDFDFGSFNGIQAAKADRPIGRIVTPTDAETARFTPELGLYTPGERESELNAKVKGARGAEQYLQRQERLQVVSASSEIAVQSQQFAAPASKAGFKDALIALKEEASKRFVEVDESIDQFIGSYKDSLAEIESISQRAAQSAGSATREEVAGLQQEMNAAIVSLSGVFDAVRGEIQRVQAIVPAPDPVETERVNAFKAPLTERLGTNQAEAQRLLAVTDQNTGVAGVDRVRAVVAKQLAEAQQIVQAIDLLSPEEIADEGKELGTAYNSLIAQIEGNLKIAGKLLESQVAAAQESANSGLATTIAPAQTETLPQAPIAVEAVPVLAPPEPKQPEPAKPAQPIPREGREGLFQDLNEQYSVAGLRDIAKRVGITSNRAKGLKKEDLARELASTDFGVPIDKVLAEVGDSAKLKAFQTGSQSTVPKLPAEALTSIKTASEKLKQLHKQFQTAQGQQRLALAQAIATESDREDCAIDQAFKEFQIEGRAAQQLAGLRTQLTQRSELPRSEARDAARQPIQETQRQGSTSRAPQTVTARVVDRSLGEDLDAANLLTSLREGSQTVNRELGAAIERFNQAQQTLATTISREVARFAEIEPEATLPATLQKAAGTPKGKDLLVNTAGFAASVAGQQFGGPVGSLAGDLLGALAARNALSGGQFGQGDDLFGDLAGFAIGNGAAALGNMVPGVAGIPFKGAAAAMATVPQLSKLRQRLQGRLGEDDEAKASGDDLTAANLTSGATGIQRTLTSKSRQLFSQLEKQLGDTIDKLALALSSDKDYAGNAGQQEIRSLNQLNQTVERLLNERGQIIDETFDAEMARANQELLQIGARIAAKTEARPDFGLLADRAIDDGTQAKSQQVIGENQQELRENKRRAFELEQRTGVVADASLTRIEDPIAGGDGLKGIFGNLGSVFKGIQADIRAAVTKQAEALTVESKSLLNDIRSSQAVAKGAGDKTQAKRLGKAGDRAEQAIAGSEAILSKPTNAITDKEIAKLREYRKELLSIYKLLDRPPPTPPATGGGGGFGQLADVFGKLKPLIGPVLAGLIGFQGIQFAITQLRDFTLQAIQAAIKLDNLKTALNFASGSSTVGAQNLAFVRGEVERLRVPLGAAQEGFVKLAASTRGTGSQSATQPLFTGIQSASTVLGLTGEESSGTSLAFSQIASKGKVYTEELLQLQERIPGFITTVQRALGLSGAELSKALQSGSISADEFLPKIARQLQVEFGGAAVDASKNAQSAIFNVQNKFLELQQAVGAAFGPALVAGANLLAKILEGIANKASDGAQGINKIAATLGIILTPINAIGSALAGIPGIGKAFEVAMNAVLAVVLVIAASVAISLLGKLLALPAIAKVIAAGFSAIGGSLATAFAALPALLAKFFLLQLAVEAVTGALSVFVPSELGNQFKGFADQAEANLKRIEEAAKKAKGEVKSVAPPSQLESEGPDIGKALTFGAFSFKTDDFVKGRNAVFGKVGSTVGLGEDFGRLKTVAETKSERDVLEADRFGDNARTLTASIFEQAPEIQAKLREVADLDKQTQAVQNQRALAASKPQVDKTELAGFDNRLRELNAKRETASAPLIEQRGAITAQLANAKAGLQAIDAKNLPTEQAQQLKAPFEAAVSQLEKAQAAINKFEGGIKTSVSAGRELTTTFTKLATELEEARRVADRVFNQSSQNILKQQFTNFTKDPRASQQAAVDQAKTEQTRLQSQFDAGETTLDQQKTALSGADAQTLLGTVPIGNSGKTITIDSSLSEIEEALKGTPDNQTDKKAILERLKEFREGTDKQQQLGTQVEQSRLTAQKAEETSALTDIDRDATKRDNELKRADNERAIPLRKASAALVRDKANNKFFSDADAGVAEADLGIKSAQNQVVSVDAKEANTQQSLEELNAQKGKISAEEFQKRQMALTTQLADLRVEKANAAAAVEEALAKKVEATNRKIIEGLELANQKAAAAIQLSETNQTTGTKKKLLASGLIDRNEKVVGIEQTDIDAEATQKRNALIQKEIADYQKLAADKRISGKELNDKLLGFNQELAANNGKLVDLQIQKQKQLRDLFNFDVDRSVAASNRGDQAIIRGLQRQKAAIDQINKSLEISRKLTESRSSLQQAIAQYNQTIAQGAVDQASKKVEIANKAETEQDPTKREGYEKIARSLGVADPSDKEALLDQKLAAEQNLADIKQRALETEYVLKQQLLELDLKRDKLQAEQAFREAQIAELTEKKNVTKATGELKKAIKEGDADKIAEARSNLDDSLQAYDLSKQSTAGAREGLAATGELEANARAKFGVERDTAFAQAGQEQQNLRLSQATERVEAGLDPDKALNNGGGVTVSSAGVQSGNYASLGASPFRVGGGNNDDRGLRQNNSDSFALAARRNMPLALPGDGTPAPDASSGVVEASGATSDRMGSFFDSLTSAVTQRLDVLIDLQRQDMGNPKSVTLNATDPVETYAQYQNRQTGNALRNQPAF